ncbi:unnamed protein product [Parajaminaea phylloscopi]
MSSHASGDSGPDTPPSSAFHSLAATYATSPYSAYALSGLFFSAVPASFIASHRDAERPGPSALAKSRTPLAKALDAHSIEQAVRSRASFTAGRPVLRQGLAPFWQLAGFGGLIGLGGYIISQNDTLNGAGTVTAWSLCYLAFHTIPSLRSARPLPIALTLSTAILGAGLHGIYYFDKTSWQGAFPAVLPQPTNASTDRVSPLQNTSKASLDIPMLLFASGAAAAAPRSVRTSSTKTASALRFMAQRQSSTSSHAAALASKAARFVKPLDPAHIPRGFAPAFGYAGIKAAISPKPVPDAAAPTSTTKGDPKPDLALIISTTEKAAAAAGTFTRNVFKAAPVVLSSEILLRGAKTSQGSRARSILVNSGCANAVTGQQGLDDAKRCGSEVAKLLNHKTGKEEGTLLLSTGVIGVPLPMQAISSKLPALAEQLKRQPEGQDAAKAWHETSRAFMTTDTFPKLRARTFKLGDEEYRILGIDKGAGMIHPGMSGPGATSGSGSLHATLLGFIATDAPIAPAALQQALEHAVERSFNCISVDGDMSTNDTILALANGDGKEIDAASPLYATFERELTKFCIELAQLIVRDGEGAEKFVEVRVRNAPSYRVAHAVASSISTSALVKCALHGGDANWGRILCAVGYAKLPTSEGEAQGPEQGWSIDPAKVTVNFLPPSTATPEDGDFKPLLVLENGTPQKVDEAEAGRLLALEDIVIDLDLQGGSSASGNGAQHTQQATYWTCDFSKEYVAINGDYRS